MIRFDVVKEMHGWSVRAGGRMTAPFRSRDLAIQEAHGLARAIRRHGERATVVVEGLAPDQILTVGGPARWAQRDRWSPVGGMAS